jgi:long-chain fatty acid transport protein
MEYRRYLECEVLNMRKFSAVAITILTFLAIPVPVFASMGEICGLGIRSQSMAGTGVALTFDGSEAYANPAGLTGVNFFKDVGLTTEFGISTFDLKGTVDSSINGKHSPSGQESVTNIGFNISADLSAISKYLGGKPLVFGGTFLIPTDSLYWWRAQLPEEERYIFYYDDLHRLVAVAGLGYEPVKWLSIGVSANILLKLETNSSGPVYVDQQAIKEIVSAYFGPNGNQQYVDVTGEIAEDQKTKLSVSPIIGIQIKPTDKISFGFTWRDELYMDDYGKNHVEVLIIPDPDKKPLTISFDYDHHFAHYYSPSQWAFGAAYTFNNGLKLSADLTWMQWSGYLDILHNSPTPSFRDVPNIRAGAEKEIIDSSKWLGDMTLRGGYSFWKSPVPDQTGTTNYLDNDKHIFSIGTENRWDKPGKYWSKPISIQTMAQYHYLIDRTYTKTATGEKITLSGYAFTAGISAEFKF